MAKSILNWPSKIHEQNENVLCELIVNFSCISTFFGADNNILLQPHLLKKGKGSPSKTREQLFL